MLTVATYALVVLSMFTSMARADGGVTWGIATFNNDKCQGSPVATSAIDNSCKDISQVADLYYQNVLQVPGVLSLAYDCSMGIVMVASDAQCATVSDVKAPYYAQDICLKGNGTSFRPTCPTYACQPKFKLKLPACNQRISQCDAQYNVHMKW